jgi:GNAT superfamily N-acetyltransferase
VKDITSQSLDQFLTLYRDSFPQSERRPEPDLIHALTTPAYHLLTKIEQDRLIGFAILFMPPAADFALLEYLAVHPSWRSKGHGADLVQSAIEQSRDRPLLTELECASNDPLPHRRQQFYRRAGFTPIPNLRYELPLPGNPPPMELWVHQESPAAIEHSQLTRWLITIYTDVYARPANDPRITQMLSPHP